MRVIFQSYTICSQNDTGGVQNRLRTIMKLLAKRNVEVELFNPFETKLRAGDILHVFMLSMDNASLVQYAHAMGVKIVVSSIVPLIDKGKLFVYRSLFRLPLVTSYKINRKTLELADAVITESQQESDFIHRYYGIPKNKMTVIPNGVDVDDYCGEDIFDRIGTKDKYALLVGRFDSNKNQLNVIKALRGQPYQLVLIGGPEKKSSLYYEECVREAQGFSNIHFLGWVPSDSGLLKSAYAHADTVILASHYETFGLTAIEGAAKGAKIVLSRTLPLKDYPEFKDCLSFNPSSVREIEEVVTESLRLPANTQMRDRVIHGFNWEAIIDKHIELYNNL